MNAPAYQLIDSPIGTLMVVVGDAGVLRVAFETEDLAVVRKRIAHRLGVQLVHDGGATSEAIRQIGEYFAGQRRNFDLLLDWSASSGFRGEVQRFLGTIGYGRAVTYAQIAKALGHPGASRAVGTACATNPLPIILPCHRVIRSDGGLGGYLGGLAAKRFLLDLEGSSR